MKALVERRKLTQLMIAASFLAGLLTACSGSLPAAAVPPRTASSIRVVMDNNYPPYIFLDEAGKPQGILVDQWSLWEERTGVKVELSAIHWEDALEGMKNGEFDVIDTIFHTDERAEIYDFTDAYARIDVPIFFHNDISGIADVGDLKGFRVAVKSGDADAGFLEDAGITDLVYYDSYEEIIQAVARGDENVFVIDQPPGLYFLYKYGLQDQFKHSEPLFSGEFHRAVKKGDAALLQLIEAGFSNISKYEYLAIDNRWLGNGQDQAWKSYLPYIQAGIAIALLSIIVLVVFARTLQRRVRQQTRELKQALDDLQESERKYREIFNATTEAIFVHAADGRLLHVNEPMIRMYGYGSEEEVLSTYPNGLTFDEPPYAMSNMQEKMRLALEEGPQVFEWPARRKNGEVFWTEISLRVSQIGGERQILAVARDITKRRKAEESLRASESQLKEAQEIANMGSYRVDFSTGMWESSAILDRIFGIDAAYIRSVEGWGNIIHPDHRQWMLDYFANEVMGKHIPFDMEYKITRQNDKAERWVHGYGTLEVDRQGNLLNMRGIIQDITERKQAEEALRESEELYRKMNENSPLGMHFYRLEEDRLIFTGANPAADQLLGVDNSQFIGKPIEEAFPPLAKTEVPQRYRDAAAKGIPWSTEQIAYEDRQIKGAFEVRAFKTTPGNMVAVFADITARKQAEQLLRERERQYRTLVEQIPAVVYVDDVSMEIRPLYIGPQIEQVFGYAPGEWLEAAHDIWLSSLHPDDRETVHARYRRCAEQGEPFNVEYRISTRDGRLVWIHDEAVLLHDESGNPQLLHGVMQDITGRKQAENEMRQRVMELETLYESGLAINQLLDPKEIGEKVIELLWERLDWHHTTIRLYHPEDESLELLAFNQPGMGNESERNEIAGRFSTLVANSGQGVSGWAVRHKQVVRLNDLSNDPRYVDTYPGLQSGLYVPMLIGDRVAGVISIESEKPNAFSSADERLAATLANQAASALENARLFEAERKQRQLSDALRDALSAGASMSASLDFETILDRLLETLEHVVPFESACIMIVDAESQKINIAKLRGYDRLDEQSIKRLSNFSFDIAATENLRWMIENKQPLVISDADQYPGWFRIPEASFIRSWAGAPIVVNDEVIALFSLDSAKPNFFTNEHLELMRAFTGQASLALQNARLFEQTERRLNEFSALYETSRILSGGSDLTGMLRGMVEQAAKLLGATSSGIYLHLRENDELELTVDVPPFPVTGTRLKFDEGVAGYVARNRQPLRVDDYSTWEKRSPKYENVPFRAVLGVPMLYGGELIGVLMVGEMGDSTRKFTEADERLLSLFASQAAGAIHSARLREQTTRRLDQLQALHTIDRAITSSFDLHPILGTVIAQAITQLNVDAVDVLLYRPLLQTLEYVAGQGFRSRAIEQSRLRLGECFSGRAALERRTIHIPDLSNAGSDFTRAALLKAEDFVEFHVVPLIAKGEVKGILEVFHRSALPSDPEWLGFLETLAEQAAITIDQTQLFDNLQRANLELVIAYDATIEGWARALDLRDKETESHTERVTELTIALARAMEVKESEILNMRRGALLHDIGKMGVPDNILLKDGKLTDEEWEVMRRHPQLAHDMLQPIKYLREALNIPYHHHEKWDGTGYPNRLKGEQIPLSARIFAIVDVWDAVTSDRPYRKAWTREQALSYIQEQSEKQFDPKVVDAFMKMVGN